MMSRGVELNAGGYYVYLSLEMRPLPPSENMRGEEKLPQLKARLAMGRAYNTSRSYYKRTKMSCHLSWRIEAHF